MLRFRISLLAIALMAIFTLSTFASDAKIHFEFIKSKYDQHDKKLHDFLILELKTYLQLFPGSSEQAEALYLLARVYRENGDVHRAMANFLKTLFIYPNSLKHSAAVGDIHEIIAKNSSYKNKKEKITTVTNGKFESDSQANNHYRFLEFIYELGQSKLYDYALNEYYDFLIKYPSHDQIDRVHRWIAGSYAAKGDDKAAVAAYLKYEKLFPESIHIPQIKINRAKVLSDELKDYDGSIKALTDVITSYPGTDQAGTALLRRANVKIKKSKDFIGSVIDLRQLVAEMPEHEKAVDALFQIAEIKEKKLRSYIAAIDVYEEIVAGYPENKRGAEALVAAAKLHTKIKEPKRAAEKYAQFAELYPANEKAPDMLFRAASIYESKLKEYQNAIDHYQMIKTKFPDSEHSRKAEKKISSLSKKI